MAMIKWPALSPSGVLATKSKADLFFMAHSLIGLFFQKDSYLQKLVLQRKKQFNETIGQNNMKRASDESL
jgi:hypothetical protein